MLDRLDDIHVAGATADVAADPPADLILGRMRVALDERRTDEHHPGRAEPALQAMLRMKSFLDRMQLAALRETLDRGDAPALDLDGEHRAGFHRAAVEQYRAGTAVAGIAADVRPGHAQLGANEINQQGPWLRLGAALGPVHVDRDLHAAAPCARLIAVCRPRCTKTRATSRLYSPLPRISAFGSAASPARREASAITSSDGA